MAEFYSKTNTRPCIALSVGEKKKPEYSIGVDEFGHKYVYQSGWTNLYDKIQESREDCKIENILKRATLGDEKALNKYVPLYFDATNMPENLAEAQQSIINLENIFDKLPKEVRQRYNFSPKEYIADFMSPTWLEVMGFSKKESASNEQGTSVEDTENNS